VTEGWPIFEPDRISGSRPKGGPQEPRSVGATTSIAGSRGFALEYFDATGRHSTAFRSDASVYEIGVEPAVIDCRDELGEAFGNCNRMATLLVVAMGQV